MNRLKFYIAVVIDFLRILNLNYIYAQMYFLKALKALIKKKQKSKMCFILSFRPHFISKIKLCIILELSDFIFNI